MEIIILVWRKCLPCENWYVFLLHYQPVLTDIRSLELDPPPKEPVYVIGLRYHILYLLELSELEDLGLGSRTGVVPILSDNLPFDTVRLYGPVSQEDNEHFMKASRSEFSCTSNCESRSITNPHIVR